MTEKVYVEAAGCDRRQLDVSTIRTYLRANGYELVDDPAKADRILVATCAFKKKEEDESVRRLRALRKYDGEVLVYGCLPDIAGERYPEFSDLPSVAPRDIESIDDHFGDITVPFASVQAASTLERESFSLDRVRRRVEHGLNLHDEIQHRLHAPHLPRERGLADGTDEPWYLFVSRGCLGSCTYCAIRRSIGTVKSRPVDDIVADFRRGTEQGYSEFNILGDDPGCYGMDCGLTLPGLLGALLTACAGPPGATPNGEGRARFHLREIHPRFLIRYAEELLALPDLSRVATILCPAQSGSDRVLSAMQRQHTSAQLLDTLQRIRATVPQITLDTQIIVGFPGETRAEFEETLAFVTSVGFDSVVVFPYHDKVGTPASALADKVADKEINHRMRAAFHEFRQAGVPAYYSCP